ncbi:acyl-homoserine-lactone synthase [Vibrio sp. S4M6]|uniref:acyl-homoserine-lactone synthase n=1 Tax=Vibrio sinus TaxID=2946865 RepID=UPI002029B757|nr:acyl-homoserine-lactone synthase [Vibrio sinus]MCL9782029.1 acyl-homoserine-lactone synthase [Vibrio sinus]
MNYASMFSNFLYADITKESTIFNFFKLVKHYISTHDSHLFCRILNVRKSEILSGHPELSTADLSKIFSKPFYKSLVGRPAYNLTKEYLIIEQVAFKLFSNWLEFWCSYLIYEVKDKYSTISNTGFRQKPKLPYNDEAYTSEVIPDIATEDRLFYTLHHDQPMKLRDAIYLINLELFVKDAKWYEVLCQTHLSRAETHLVVSTRTIEADFPIIVSTALIQGWDKRKQWLSYNEYFQSKKWRYCLPNDSRLVLNRSGILKAPLKTKYLSTKDFECDFQNKLQSTNKVCEILRLSVSGTIKQKMYYLYLSQKHLVEKVFSLGYDFCLTIIDQPFLLNYYSKLSNNAYFSSSYYTANNVNHITYKGFWNTRVLMEHLRSCDFIEYKNTVNSNNWNVSEKLYAQ